MATIEEMQVKLTLDLSELNAKTDQMKAQLDGLGRRVSDQKKPFEDLKGAIGKVTLALGGMLAAGKALDFLKDSAKAATEDAKSHELLANQLRNSVGANQGMIDSAEKSIKALETMSAVADDNIRPAFALLTRATGDVGEASRMTELALNVAAGTGKDLQAVSIALAKAHDGNTGALQKLGLSVKGVSDPMALLEKQFAGAAATAANNDPYQRMSLALDNIHESVGVALLPLLEKFANWFVTVQPKIEAFFTALTDPTTKVGAQFKSFTDIIMGAFDWLTKNLGLVKNLVIALAALTAGLKLAAVAQGLLDIAMNANPIGLVTVAVVGLTAALAGLYGLMSSHAGEAQAGVNKAAAAAGQKAYDKVMQDKANWEASNTGTQLKSGTAMKAEKARTDAIQAYIKAHPIKTDSGGGTTGSTASTVITGGGGGGGGGGGVTAAEKAAAEKTLLRSLASIRQNILEAQKKFNDDLAQLQKDYATKIANIQKEFQTKLVDVVNQSKALLINAFQQATNIDVGSMFASSFATGSLSTAVTTQVKNGLTTVVSWWGSAQSGGGVAGLLNALQTKLAASKQLSDNAAKLAGAGFSQTFIDQIVAQGTDLGNQMASAILQASPATQRALQSVFAEANAVSAHGVDALATQLYNTQGLATEALRDLYTKTEQDFKDALTAADAQFNADSQKLYDDLQKSLADANAKMTEALQTAADAMGVSLTTIKSKYKDEIGQITDLIAKVRTEAKKALDDAQAAAKAMAEQAYTDTTQKLAPNPNAGDGTPKPYDPTKQVGGGANPMQGYGTGFNVNTYVQSNADPSQISTSIVNAIKLNAPTVVSSGWSVPSFVQTGAK